MPKTFTPSFGSHYTLESRPNGLDNGMQLQQVTSVLLLEMSTDLEGKNHEKEENPAH